MSQNSACFSSTTFSKLLWDQLGKSHSKIARKEKRSFESCEKSLIIYFQIQWFCNTAVLFSQFTKNDLIYSFMIWFSIQWFGSRSQERKIIRKYCLKIQKVTWYVHLELLWNQVVEQWSSESSTSRKFVHILKCG